MSFLNDVKNKQELDELNKIVWNELTYKQKVLATRYVLNAILNNHDKQGSYRNLIYSELGFGTDSYSVLLKGMAINNMIDDYVPGEFVDEEVLDENNS